MLGRLQVSASRLLATAPTIARMVLVTELAEQLFCKVGTYQYSNNTLIVKPEHNALWLDWSKGE